MQIIDLKDSRLARTYLVGYPLQVLGLILQSTGVIIVIVLTVFATKTRVIPHIGFFKSFVYYTSGIIATFCGRYIFHVGKKLTVEKAAEIMRQDTRNPVLFLRSFIDDEITARVTDSGMTEQGLRIKSALRSGLPLPDSIAFSVTTEEEVLANELKRIGPCIAVGRPGEWLPRLGMARMYFDNENWETGVQQLMERAELVVMRAGITAGFLRELEMTVKFLNPKKLLILLPFDGKSQQMVSPNEPNGYTEFREAANRILPKELPMFSGGKMSGASLSGIIWFESDWTPKTLSLDGDTLKSFFESLSIRYSHYGVLHWGE